MKNPANRLARSTSPYLLQHAANPVAWQPWDDEAFQEARRRDVPIFVSIGYSTCYWCHVMERESFENEAIARLMNDNFVCIKVDREERPDIDDIYMTATQIMTGHGGWPMSVFLEPASLRPFWCGTYFPPAPRPGIGVPAFPHVLENIARAYRSQRQEVLDQASQVADLVRQRLAISAPRGPIDGLRAVTDAVSGLLRSFDQNHGGFGAAPKFPQPDFLAFLLDARATAGSSETREAIDRAVRLSLDKMMIGGMHDQLAGGFHRYSVDSTWTVPHFEKMLYDNALLARLFARAAMVYGDQEYARTARQTCRYMIRELMIQGAGFASGQDAEVDGREGLNYLWKPEQIRAVLSADDAQWAIRVFSLESGPNFADPHHPGEPASSVLRLQDRPDRIWQHFAPSLDAFRERFDRIAAALLAARSERKQPRLDDKVLAAWNGLAIGALAYCGRVLEETAFVRTAERAAEWVCKRLRASDGLLARSFRLEAVGDRGFLEDYAFLSAGLLDLAKATGVENGQRRAAHAQALASQAIEQFGDGSGGFFDASADIGDLFVRARSIHDGAIPCGTTVLLHCFLELHERCSDGEWAAHAQELLKSLAGEFEGQPLALVHGLRSVLRVLASPDLKSIAGVLQGESRPSESSSAFTPVEIYASTDRITLSPDTPAAFKLVLQIADGFHVIAADPWISDPQSSGRGLIPLRVQLIGGTGLAVFADYPRGTSYDAASNVMGKPHVYTGRVEFDVAVEQTEKLTGRPLLAVTFQACSGTECQLPRTVELDIAIDAA
ncbi:MAG: thioredoxin domain-containing protein [Phycisphaerales bacterium]|nr:thioredoxin domain-containing protein [Planctomycetota bacterium]